MANEIAVLSKGLEKCACCPAMTRDCDNDGNPIHDECVADREATRIDQAYERGRELR